MSTRARRSAPQRRSATSSASRTSVQSGRIAGLSALDDALDSVSASQSKEEAMASLAKATALLNAYMAPSTVGASSAAGSRVASLDDMFRTQTFLDWGQPDAASWLGGLEDRLKKYFETVRKVVDAYGPDQYQISLGFPSGVSVAFTWNVRHP
jgi:hypothetical protein